MNGQEHNNEVDFLKTTLINVFSQYRVDEIDNYKGGELIKEAFGKNWKDSYIKDSKYIKYYNKALNAKKRIEDIISKFKKNSDQVRKLISLINKLEKDDDKYICAELIKKTNSIKWDPKNQSLFNNYCEIILETVDYFISYTNRDPVRTYQKCESIFWDKPSDEELKNKNSVAVLLNEELRQDLKGFFDKDTLTNGENFGKEIYNYCKKAFTFVQLIERKSFESHIEETNWCYYEYCIFTNPRERLFCECCNNRENCDVNTSITNNHCTIDQKINRVFFLLVDKEINFTPESSPLEYDGWYKDIKRKNNDIIIEGLKASDFEKEIKKIRTLIKSAKEKFINELCNLGKT